jgi:hypothetical protein
MVIDAGGPHDGRVCHYAPVTTAPLHPLPPRATPPSADHANPEVFTVALSRSPGGTVKVPVALNDSVEASFLVDSGSTDVTLPPSVADRLRANGTLTEADYQAV